MGGGVNFINKDLIDYKDFPFTDLIVLRDVIFHLTLVDVNTIFENIKGKFKYIVITNCRNEVNSNEFNKWRYSKRNILIEPFNRNHNYLYIINENVFKRDILLYEHSNFYETSEIKKFD